MAFGKKKIPSADAVKDKDSNGSKSSVSLIEMMKKEWAKALKIDGDLKNKSSFAYRLNSNKKYIVVAIGAVFVSLIGLKSCMSDAPKSTGIVLKGNEAVQSYAQSENMLNEEQNAHNYNEHLSAGQQDAINIERATKRFIKKGRFDIVEIQSNPNRFKQVPTSMGTLYIDIVTKDAYDLEGNLVDFQHQPAYIEQAPIDYNNSGQANAGGGLQARPEASQQDNNSQAPANVGISAELQGTIDNLNYNNQNTQTTLNLIEESYRTQQQQYLQAQQQQQQAYYQQLNQYETIANQQIQTTIAKLYEPSQFSTVTNAVGYNANGFNTTSFATPTITTSPIGANSVLANETQSPYLPKSVLRQGSVMLVMITTEVNTDKSNLVHGLILDGVYSGAKIQGTVVRKPKDIGVNFNLIYPTNPRLPVVQFNGVALDLVTNHDGVATSVRNHYIQNYTALVAKSAIEGYGNAYTNNTGQTVIERSDGTIITTSDGRVDDAEIRGQMYASLAQRINSDTANWGNRPPTFKIKQGTVLAVQLQANLETDPTKRTNGNTETLADSNMEGRYTRFTNNPFVRQPPFNAGVPQALPVATQPQTVPASVQTAD